MAYLKHFGQWCRKNLFRQRAERFPLLAISVVILVFNLIVVGVLVPVMMAGPSQYQRLAGTPQYAVTRSFTETRATRLGDRAVQETRLVLRLREYTRPFIIGPDYRKYWPLIEQAAARNDSLAVYLRPGNGFVNPMQVETPGRVLLPLAFHRQWAWWLFVLLESFCLLFFFMLRGNWRLYKKHLLQKDREKWRSGFKGKIKVIGWWFSR